jgi:hypothetical protein
VVLIAIWSMNGGDVRPIIMTPWLLPGVSRLYKVSGSNLPEDVAGVRVLPSKKFPGQLGLEPSECIA